MEKDLISRYAANANERARSLFETGPRISIPRLYFAALPQQAILWAHCPSHCCPEVPSAECVGKDQLSIHPSLVSLSLPDSRLASFFFFLLLDLAGRLPRTPSPFLDIYPKREKAEWA